MYHFLFSISSQLFQDHLTSDLKFAYVDLKKNFYVSHNTPFAYRKNSDSWMLNLRPKRQLARTVHAKTRTAPASETRTSIAIRQKTDSKEPKGNKSGLELPICLHKLRKDKGIRDLVLDCPEISNNERKQILKDLADARAKDGPSRSTRSQTMTDSDTPYAPVSPRNARPHTAQCLQRDVLTHDKIRPSCSNIVSDGIAQLAGTGRCDDGSDENIVFLNLA